MDKEEKKKLDLGFLEKYKVIAISAFVIVVGVYVVFNILPDFTLDINDNWGAMGDFIGGILNPIFGLMALFALLATIKIQSEELSATRDELELTRGEISKSTIAQEKQSDSLLIQNQSIKQQNFENTFFNMLDLHNKNIDNISLGKLSEVENIGKLNAYGCYKIKDHTLHANKRKKLIDSLTQSIRLGIDKTILEMLKRNIARYNQFVFDDKDYHGKKSIERLRSIFVEYLEDRKNYINNDKDIEQHYENFHDEYQEIIGHYFGTIYQVLKFIDDSDIEDKERYSSLFRSQFTKSELELLFYHGTSKVARKRFAPLLIKFEFFEHLSCSDKINEYFIYFYTDSMDYKKDSTYALKAFGKNKQCISHFISIEIKKANQAPEPL